MNERRAEEQKEQTTYSSHLAPQITVDVSHRTSHLVLLWLPGLSKREIPATGPHDQISTLQFRNSYQGLHLAFVMLLKCRGKYKFLMVQPTYVWVDKLFYGRSLSLLF